MYKASTFQQDSSTQRMKLSSSFACTLLLALCFYISPFAEAANNVTYDSRSLIIDGQRKLLISAAIHYPRSVPAVSSLI